MNAISSGGAHVPAFLAKLWKIVDDLSTNNLICWSEHGNSFIIHNQSEFARDLLPLYYKHNNMASFVRQLNMYGFHKVVSVEHGGLRVEKDEMEFAHPFFLQGNEDSLELIKRKVSTSKFDDTKARPDSYNKVLMDVHHMKGRQESMDTKLLQIRRENEALWTELSSLRQKHSKQQQIVSKLIQFLVSMMSTQSHRIGFKRRLPLMLNDSSAAADGIKDKATTSKKKRSTGAVIHDVTEVEDEPIIEECASGLVSAADQKLFEAEELNDAEDQVQGQGQAQHEFALPDDVNVNVPVSNVYLDDLNGNLDTAADQDQDGDQTTATTAAAAPDPKLYVAEELDGHLGQTQSVLDNLRDLLLGSQYKIDPNALTGLFAHDTDSSQTADGEANNKEADKGLITPDFESETTETGTEVATYNPCLFELAEDDAHFFEEDPGSSSGMFLDLELENMMTTHKSRLAELANANASENASNI